METVEKDKLDNLFINEEDSILDALSKLDKNGMQILFIKNNERLVACLTDGDIRKALLAGGQLNTRVGEICNFSPLYLFEYEAEKAENLIRKKGLRAIPIVSVDMEIREIIFTSKKIQFEPKRKLDLPVVMMAGGLGTRLFPYTKILPKPLVPVADVPIAERIMNEFFEVGCEVFYVVVNYKKEMIKAYFNETTRDYKIQFVDESEPLGTAGGLALVRDQINQSFFLTNCDILIRADLREAYEYHKKNGNSATIICSLKNYQIPYGVVKFGVNGVVESMEEKPSMAYYTNTGCYILEPEVFNHIEEKKCVGMPQVLEKMMEVGLKVGVYPISENSWLDMGEMDSLKLMTERLESE